jgi:hypothetical protein
MANKASAISIRSGYGIKPVEVDGITVATVLKFAVKKDSMLHAAYWTAFDMYDFKDSPKLYLQEQYDVCKNKSHVRLYCMAKSGQEWQLRDLYTKAQVLVREVEIAEFKGETYPEWYTKFLTRRYQQQYGFDQFSLGDDLPF